MWILYLFLLERVLLCVCAESPVRAKKAAVKEETPTRTMPSRRAKKEAVVVLDDSDEEDDFEVTSSKKKKVKDEPFVVDDDEEDEDMEIVKPAQHKRLRRGSDGDEKELKPKVSAASIKREREAAPAKKTAPPASVPVSKPASAIKVEVKSEIKVTSYSFDQQRMRSLLVP